MVLSTFFVSILVAALAFGKPVRRTLVMHEAIASPPEGFARTGPADPSAMLQLRLAMKQSNQAGLEDALLDMSTPGNANYGKQFTKEQVEEFVRPTQDTQDAVNAFLTENSIAATPISPAGNWLQFSISVSQANKLFNADFSEFTHTASGQSAIRTLSYAIPADLSDAIVLLHPTVSFWNPEGNVPKFTSPVPSKVASDATAPASCATTVTITCIQDLYGIPTTAATQSSNGLGVSGFIQQFANQADLTQFLTDFRPSIDKATFALQTLDGGKNTQTRRDAGVEANLDTQMTVGLATSVPVTFISVGNNFQDGNLEGFLDIINFLLAESNPPHVLTTSYGQNENTISRALANELCAAYVQLGARGTSILFASGDGGVSGSQSASCTTFVPTFPSGCQFMTSVGATTGTTETAATFSAGGFSNYFGQPSYQTAAVEAYFAKLGTTNSGKFNTSGRGYPDVSAQGENVEIVVDAETGTVAGTSCASPIFASVISLINDQIIAAGGSPLGFLNPFLYANPSALNDITTGDNPGCNTNGFPTEVGWDPVTGLGTPNFAKLLAAAQAAAGL